MMSGTSGMDSGLANQEAAVYKELATSVVQDTSNFLAEKKPGKKGEQLAEFLHKHAPLGSLQDGVVDDMRHRYFILDNRSKPKKKYNMKRSRQHKLSSKEKRNLKLFKIPKEQSFDSFIPLHRLWKDYMKNVMNFSRMGDKNPPDTQQQLLKADYHGALVAVTKSKTPSLIGQTGIIIQETKNVFRIVTKDNRVKTIPKDNSLFTTEIEGFTFTINGSNFLYSPAERVHRKFKFKPRNPNDL